MKENPVHKFGGLMAHLINGNDDLEVEVNLTELESWLLYYLETNHYCNYLLQQASYRHAVNDPSTAASYYVEHVIKRPVGYSSAGTKPSVTHRLFQALCRRGAVGGWERATLRRHLDVATSGVVPLHPRGFKAVAERLAACIDRREEGCNDSPARRAHGPFYLELGEARVELPEAMSIWDALECAPRVLRSLQGRAGVAFGTDMINALCTANRPVQVILSLKRGLNPFEWLNKDFPTQNQWRQIERFCRSLPVEHRDRLWEWEVAWERNPIPRYRDVTSFFNSEVGRALREHFQFTEFNSDVNSSTAISKNEEALQEASSSSSAPGLGVKKNLRPFEGDNEQPEVSDNDADDPPVDDEEAPEFNDETEFNQRLQVFLEAGHIEDRDHRLLMAIYQGLSMEEAFEQAKINIVEADQDSYLEDLRERLLEASKQL